MRGGGPRTRRTTHHASSRPRFLAVFVAVSIDTASVVAGVVSASSASATASTRSAPTELIGTAKLNRLGLTTSSVLGVHAGATLDTTLDWLQPATVSTQIDPDLVRGEFARPHRPRSVVGNRDSPVVNWRLNNLNVGGPHTGRSTSAPSTQRGRWMRSLLAGGPDYMCHLEGASTTVAEHAGVPGYLCQSEAAADLTVTPAAIASLRTVVGGGTRTGPRTSLGESPIVDTLPIRCAAGVGDHLGYSLGSLSSTPGISVQTTLVLDVGTSVDNPDYPRPARAGDLPPALSAPFPMDSTATSVAMTGAGATFDLGAVQQSNVRRSPTRVVLLGDRKDRRSPSTVPGAPAGADRQHCTGPSPDRGARHPGSTRNTHVHRQRHLLRCADPATGANGLSSTTPFSVTVANVAQRWTRPRRHRRLEPVGGVRRKRRPIPASPTGHAAVLVGLRRRLARRVRQHRARYLPRMGLPVPTATTTYADRV